MLRRFTRWLPWLLVVFLCGAYLSSRRENGVGGRLRALVERQYIHPVSDDSLEVQTARGIVSTLGDPYAALFTPSDQKVLGQMVGAAYDGFGLEVHPATGWLVVDQVFPGSPAMRGDIRMGDTLEVLKGSFDSQTVVLGVHNNAVRQVTLERARVHVPSVGERGCDYGVGHVHLLRIERGASDEVRSAIQEYQSCAIKGWVLDLSGNRGGDMTVAMQVLGIFLGPGKVGATVVRRDGRDVYQTQGERAQVGNVVVVVDRQTASAAEVIAGALQDYGAPVVGERTWGKGVVQSVYDLSGGYALKMTTGRWFTPKGRWVGEHGGKRGLDVDVRCEAHDALGKGELLLGGS